MFRSLMIFVATFAVAAMASADYGLEVGFRQQSAASPTGSTANSQNGAQIGLSSSFALGGPLGLRVGYIYTQRPVAYKDDQTGDVVKVGLNYFDIPVALAYRFEDFASVFAGISLGLNLDSSCSGTGCKVQDVTGLVTPFQLGASFKFAPQLGATVFYEMLSGDVASLNGTKLNGYKAVGVNLMITFD